MTSLHVKDFKQPQVDSVVLDNWKYSLAYPAIHNRIGSDFPWKQGKTLDRTSLNTSFKGLVR